MAVTIDATVGGANANSYLTLAAAQDLIDGFVEDDDVVAWGTATTDQKNRALVSATDVVVVNHGSAGTAGAYVVQANTLAAGSFKITVGNVSGGALGEAIVLNFVALKGASA